MTQKNNFDQPATVAIFGATGAVGSAVLAILEQRNFPLSKLILFASAKSAGKKILFRNQELIVQELNQTNFNKNRYDLAFFTAGSKISQAWVPQVTRQAGGASGWAIDNSSFYRMDSTVPLMIPEINSASLALAEQHRIVANPNCTTAQLVMALQPLHQAFGLKRVQVASYQAVSGRGFQGMHEFTEQVRSWVKNPLDEKVNCQAFAHPIAFNCIPQIDSFMPDGFTGEEHKVMNETRKILNLPQLPVLATCVRVPVLNGHSLVATIDCERTVDVTMARKALAQMPGVEVCDDVNQQQYPLAMKAWGRDEVLVGRIRKDLNFANTLTFWVVADNLRKGAALNAVQIAEQIFKTKTPQNSSTKLN